MLRTGVNWPFLVLLRRHHEPRDGVPVAARRRLARAHAVGSYRRGSRQQPRFLSRAHGGRVRAFVRHSLAGGGAVADAACAPDGGTGARRPVPRRADLAGRNAGLLPAVPEHGVSRRSITAPASSFRIARRARSRSCGGRSCCCRSRPRGSVWRMMGLLELGPVHTMATNALHGRKRPARGAKAKAGRDPARLCNEAMGVFGSNPKGTDVLGRHSALPSSRRHLVFASSAALIGGPCHPFAFADMCEQALGCARPLGLARIRL